MGLMGKESEIAKLRQELEQHRSELGEGERSRNELRDQLDSAVRVRYPAH